MTVYASNPPSMSIIVVTDNPAEPVQLTLDPGDLARDRIDLVIDLDKDVIAMRGNVANGAQAMFPEAPEAPVGSKILAQVRVKAESTVIFDADITQFNEGVTVTGEHVQIDPDLILNPNDPFERTLVDVLKVARRKRSDYANNGNPFANFDRNAASMQLPGYTPLEDCLSMIHRKLGRIANLRGRKPNYETVVDSYLDLGVYSLLAYGLALRDIERPIFQKELTS